jgi:hypothetical protein
VTNVLEEVGRMMEEFVSEHQWIRGTKRFPRIAANHWPLFKFCNNATRKKDEYGWVGDGGRHVTYVSCSPTDRVQRSTARITQPYASMKR